jgi:glycosyltransferase involved in cell wall biosynthesis
LEAQASGLPIVTTESGGIPENVGSAAVLVPPGDAESLANALKQFILSPTMRNDYAKKARKRAETVHDIHIGSKKLNDLYQSL